MVRIRNLKKKKAAKRRANSKRQRTREKGYEIHTEDGIWKCGQVDGTEALLTLLDKKSTLEDSLESTPKSCINLSRYDVFTDPMKELLSKIVDNCIKKMEDEKRFEGLKVLVSEDKSVQSYNVAVVDVFRRRKSFTQAKMSIHKDCYFPDKLRENQDILTVVVLGSDVSEEDAPTRVWVRSQLYTCPPKQVGRVKDKFLSKVLTGKKGDVYLFDQRCYHTRDPMVYAKTLACRKQKETNSNSEHRRVIFFSAVRNIAERTLRKYIAD